MEFDKLVELTSKSNILDNYQTAQLNIKKLIHSTIFSENKEKENANKNNSSIVATNNTNTSEVVKVTANIINQLVINLANGNNLGHNNTDKNKIYTPLMLSSFISECIWIEGILLKSNQTTSNTKERLKELVSILIEKNVVSKNILIEKLEESTLAVLGLVEEEKTFKQKYNKISTKMFYEQEKYNLLREESEGYSKLVYLLNCTTFEVDEAYDCIVSLIGFFDLDPNRVLDLTISAIISNQEKELIYDMNKNKRIIYSKDTEDSGNNNKEDNNKLKYNHHSNLLVQLLSKLGNKEKITHLFGNILTNRQLRVSEIIGLLKSAYQFIYNTTNTTNNSNANNSNLGTKLHYDMGKIIEHIKQLLCFNCQTKLNSNNYDLLTLSYVTNNNNDNIKELVGLLTTENPFHTINNTNLTKSDKREKEKSSKKKKETNSITNLTNIYDSSLTSKSLEELLEITLIASKSIYCTLSLLLKADLVVFSEILPYTGIEKSINQNSLSYNNINKKAIMMQYNWFKVNKNVPFQKNMTSLGDFTISAGSDELGDIVEQNVTTSLSFIHGYSFSKILECLIENDYLIEEESKQPNDNNTNQNSTINNKVLEAFFSKNSSVLEKTISSSTDKYILLTALIKNRLKAKTFIYYDLISDSYDCLASKDLIFELGDLISWMIEGLYIFIHPLKKVLNRTRQLEKERLNEDLNGKCLNNNSKLGNFINNSLIGDGENNTNVNSKMLVDDDVTNNYNNINNHTNYSLSKENNQAYSDELLFNQLSNLNDFFSEIPPLLNILKLGISNQYNIPLFTKILRIIVNNYSSKYKKVIVELINNVFLPSISLIEAPSELVAEIWNLLELFSWKTKFEIYDYWLNKAYYTHPALLLRHGLVLRDTGRLLKVLSKENVKQQGRCLALLCNSNPVVVINCAISNLINYTNVIDSFLSTMTYCNNLVYDCFVFVLASMLINSSNSSNIENNDKYEFSNGKYSSSYKNYASCVASFFKKFCWMDFSPFFQCIIKQVKNSTKNVVDLLIIKEVIMKMTGVGTEIDMDSSKTYAFAGGENLILDSLGVTRDMKGYKKSTIALLEMFQINSRTENSSKDNNKDKEEQINIKSNNDTSRMEVDVDKDFNSVENMNRSISFTSAMVFIIASKKNNTLFLNEESDVSIKQLSVLYDEIHVFFNQLLNSLALSNFVYYYNALGSSSNNIPDLSNSLNITYSYYPAKISNNNNNSNNNINTNTSNTTNAINNNSPVNFGYYSNYLPYKKLVIPENTPLEKLVQYYKLQPEIVFMIIRPAIGRLIEYSQEDYKRLKLEFKNAFDTYYSLNSAQFILDEEILEIDNNKLVNNIFTSVPNNAWSQVSIEFYFLFFALKISDIYTPHKQYSKQIDQLANEISNLSTDMDNMLHGSSDQLRAKKDIDKKKYSLDLLREEYKKSEVYVKKTLDHFSSIKTTLLNNTESTNVVCKYLFQYCFFPRIVLSKLDSLYTAKFILVLVKCQVHYFKVLDLLQMIRKLVIPSIVSLTDYEAENMGAFLYEIISQATSWLDEKTFLEECYNNICFTKEGKNINLNTYRGVYNFILPKIFTVFTQYLKLNEYSSVKNTLIVLNALFECIPENKIQAREMEKVVNEVIESTQEQDLSFKLSMYLIKLNDKFSLNEELENKDEKEKDKKDKDKEKDKKTDKKDKTIGKVEEIKKDAKESKDIKDKDKDKIIKEKEKDTKKDNKEKEKDKDMKVKNKDLEEGQLDKRNDKTTSKTNKEKNTASETIDLNIHSPKNEQSNNKNQLNNSQNNAKRKSKHHGN